MPVTDRNPRDSEPPIWQPLSVGVVAGLMRGFDRPWWFAGGHAIDHFLGYESRAHGDIDIACLRNDHQAIQRQLSGLELWCADPPGNLRPWRDGEVLCDQIHDIWCRQSAGAPWCLQLMLDECEGDEWVYRRNLAIRRPLESLIVHTGGLPWLAMEVQLLYKAGRPGAAMPAKNEQDFEACLPRLGPSQREWLASALQIAHAGHPWLNRLELRNSA
jgi:hypothetical protein